MNATENKRKFINGLVSVITPVFNAERFIADAIDSVLIQTYKNIEMILIDDCSEDKSEEIISRYTGKYPNIIYHKQPKNMGAGVARNTALELANGRYVAFLDADDIWKPEKTERQLELMTEKNSPMSYTAIEMIDEKGEIIKSKRPVKETCDYKILLHNTMLATSTIIVDREALGDFRMHIRRGGQDYATWLMLLRKGNVAVGINEALEQYRICSDSLSSDKIKSIRQVWEIQTQDEHIGKLAAAWHIVCFIYNAVKKYYG